MSFLSFMGEKRAKTAAETIGVNCLRYAAAKFDCRGANEPERRLDGGWQAHGGFHERAHDRQRRAVSVRKVREAELSVKPEAVPSEIGGELTRFSRRKGSCESAPPVTVRGIRRSASKLPERAPTVVEDCSGIKLLRRRKHE